ncbi:hypothetical protein ACHQM5_014303 [Ranunculus cassubicifolius]
MDEYNRSHVPAFGNWDYEDGLPITQYFESARQAGLLRYSYGEGDLYAYTGFYEEDKDLYLKPTHTIAVVPRTKTRGAGREYNYGKEQKKQEWVHNNGTLSSSTTSSSRRQHVQTAPKPIDEDLYKIPPELLYSNSKKRKRFGFFFSSCLMPSCVV